MNIELWNSVNILSQHLNSLLKVSQQHPYKPTQKGLASFSKSFSSWIQWIQVLADVRCPLPPEILGAPLLNSWAPKMKNLAIVSTCFYDLTGCDENLSERLNSHCPRVNATSFLETMRLYRDSLIMASEVFIWVYRTVVAPLCPPCPMAWKGLLGWAGQLVRWTRMRAFEGIRSLSRFSLVCFWQFLCFDDGCRESFKVSLSCAKRWWMQQDLHLEQYRTWHGTLLVIDRTLLTFQTLQQTCSQPQPLGLIWLKKT